MTKPNLNRLERSKLPLAGMNVSIALSRQFPSFEVPMSPEDVQRFSPNQPLRLWLQRGALNEVAFFASDHQDKKYQLDLGHRLTPSQFSACSCPPLARRFFPSTDNPQNRGIPIQLTWGGS